MRRKILFIILFLAVSFKLLEAGEGTILWTKILNWGMLPGENRGVAVKLDSSGNIYVAGGDENSLWLGKFDNSGNLIWQIKRDDISFWLSDGYLKMCDIDIDSSGNIYLTGFSYSNIWIGKYSAGSTNLVWSRTYNYPGADYSKPHGICVKGTVLYIAGDIEKSVPNWDSDSLLLKYDTDGNFKWAKVNDTGSSWEDNGNDVAVDNSGNVYLVGTMYDPMGGKHL